MRKELLRVRPKDLEEAPLADMALLPAIQAVMSKRGVIREDDMITGEVVFYEEVPDGKP